MLQDQFGQQQDTRDQRLALDKDKFAFETGPGLDAQREDSAANRALAGRELDWKMFGGTGESNKAKQAMAQQLLDYAKGLEDGPEKTRLIRRARELQMEGMSPAGRKEFGPIVESADNEEITAIGQSIDPQQFVQVAQKGENNLANYLRGVLSSRLMGRTLKAQTPDQAANLREGSTTSVKQPSPAQVLQLFKILMERPDILRLMDEQGWDAWQAKQYRFPHMPARPYPGEGEYPGGAKDPRTINTEDPPGMWETHQWMDARDLKENVLDPRDLMKRRLMELMRRNAGR